MPSVSRYMTREPYRIAPTSSLEEARRLMHAHSIRHLPVMNGEDLIGIVSDNDLRVVQAVPGVDLAKIECRRILAPPTCVWGEAQLDEVAELMAKNKSDCVVVLGGHGVQGVFTSVDALRALGQILERATQ